ncbi:MAG TPA: lipocalin-like domain-containing protein [Desulfomonilaceae bacterium]|nr:lipocalin-like domain-containing protein [Desulfomonilaceae bacterium]
MARNCTLLIGILVLLAAPALAGDKGFNQAVPGLSLIFPKDHGKHSDFQTEWWYFTGNLDSESGRRWGFQVTFFRRALFKQPRSALSAWNVRDVYPAHFALTDVQNSSFFHAELLSREGPDLAKAAEDDLRIHVRDWSATRDNDEIRLTAREGGYALDLRLAPEKPPVLHGTSGYSRKGDAKDQASYYYSYTRLTATGTITFQGTSHQVHGSAWMDHEFGSGMLLANQIGWDWFSLQLDDGSELMVFHLRKKDGTFEQPFGTFIPKEGAAVDLAGQRILISSKGTWTSPHTAAIYPSGWTIEIPEQKISLEITPLVLDQELSSERSTRIVYWEGAVEVRGARNGHPVHGRGYVELTGYAGSMAGRL